MGLKGVHSLGRLFYYKNGIVLRGPVKEEIRMAPGNKANGVRESAFAGVYKVSFKGRLETLPKRDPKRTELRFGIAGRNWASPMEC